MDKNNILKYFPNNNLHYLCFYLVISKGHIEKKPENIGLPAKNFGATSPLEFVCIKISQVLKLPID